LNLKPSILNPKSSPLLTMNEEFPHVFRVTTELMPPGMILCGVCDDEKSQGEVVGFDEDLGQYLCGGCYGDACAAEFGLRVFCGCRLPGMVETVGLDDAEERELVGDDGGSQRRDDRNEGMGRLGEG